MQALPDRVTPAPSLAALQMQNIGWKTGTSPQAGTYKLLVNYYQACAPGTIPYELTITVKGVKVCMARAASPGAALPACVAPPSSVPLTRRCASASMQTVYTGTLTATNLNAYGILPEYHKNEPGFVNSQEYTFTYTS